MKSVIKVHSKSNPSVFVRSFHRCSTKSFTSLRTESFAHNGVKVILNPHLNFHPPNKSQDFFLQNKSSGGFEHRRIDSVQLKEDKTDLEIEI